MSKDFPHDVGKLKKRITKTYVIRSKQRHRTTTEEEDTFFKINLLDINYEGTTQIYKILIITIELDIPDAHMFEISCVRIAIKIIGNHRQSVSEIIVKYETVVYCVNLHTGF